MKRIFFLLLLLTLFSLTNAQNRNFYKNLQKEILVENEVAKVLDNLNEYARVADYRNYFSLFADDSQFIGTGATEVWTKPLFMAWATPYFEKKKTWNFKSIQRNIVLSKDGKYAWFDELLDTQMKICRGSGVLEKIGKDWKIRQYVLSMTIPNENVNEVIKAKSTIEDKLIESLKK